MPPTIDTTNDNEMDDYTFDDVVCRVVYDWLKGDGPEPYSVAVSSLTVMVLGLIKRDRARRAKRRA